MISSGQKKNYPQRNTTARSSTSHQRRAHRDVDCTGQQYESFPCRPPRPHRLRSFHRSRPATGRCRPGEGKHGTHRLPPHYPPQRTGTDATGRRKPESNRTDQRSRRHGNHGCRHPQRQRISLQRANLAAIFFLVDETDTHKTLAAGNIQKNITCKGE